MKFKFFYLITLMNTFQMDLFAMDNPIGATSSSKLPPSPVASDYAKATTDRMADRPGERSRMELRLSLDESEESESKCSKTSASTCTCWQNLTGDLRKEIIKYSPTTELKGTNTQDVIESYKGYLRSTAHVNQQFRECGFSSYKDFLLKKLTSQDFKNLNVAVLNKILELDQKLIYEIDKKDKNNLNLLIDLLSRINKLDSTILCPTFHKEGNSLLLMASRLNLPTLVSFLIKKGADVDDTDIADQTPLILASILGNTDVVKILINSDARLNLQDSQNNTALYYAQTYGHEEIEKLLKSVGAK